MVNNFSPLKNPSGNVAKKLFTINQNENICPADWALPTIKDWEEYLKLFPENLLLAYEKAAKDNMSINLSKDGFFSTKENKLYFENEIGMYWTNKNENGKAFLVNMTNNGYMIVSEKSELIGAKIRCVKVK